MYQKGVPGRKKAPVQRPWGGSIPIVLGKIARWQWVTGIQRDEAIKNFDFNSGNKRRKIRGRGIEWHGELSFKELL